MYAIFKDPERRRAIVVPFVATMLIVLVGAAAFSVDVGYMVVANEEMQDAVDASALAGSSGLVDGDHVALARALAYAANNRVAGEGLTPAETNVTIGNWEGTVQTFYPLTGTEPTTPNAVRVEGTRPDLQLFFARALGIGSTQVNKDATASAGSGTCAGIWGLLDFGGNGNILTDSYDSTLGPYGAGNVHANGDICSNRDIVLSGSVEIYGDAMHGEDYTITIHGSAYEVWGVIGDHGGEMIPPPFDMDAAAAWNDNDSIGLTSRDRDPFRGSPWDLTLNGTEDLTLAGGTYYFTSVSMSGQATLTILGPTDMFVSGSADFTGGGLVNTSQDPSNLIIYSTGDTMKLAGNSEFYGAIVAPNTEVKLAGTSDYYGTILAGDLRVLGTTVVHVDEKLVFDLFGLEPMVPILVE